MTEQEMLRILEEALEMWQEENSLSTLSSVLTFSESGVLTENKGLVVSFDDIGDGDSEFQLTIVRSK